MSDFAVGCNLRMRLKLALARDLMPIGSMLDSAKLLKPTANAGWPPHLKTADFPPEETN
jgi:hypothetical protein